jgi:excisionase family DNA binding protein
VEESISVTVNVVGPYATVSQFAERLVVSEKLVRRWVRDGLPHVNLGTDIRVVVEDADTWVRSGGAERSAKKQRRKQSLSASRPTPSVPCRKPAPGEAATPRSGSRP